MTAPTTTPTTPYAFATFTPGPAPDDQPARPSRQARPGAITATAVVLAVGLCTFSVATASDEPLTPLGRPGGVTREVPVPVPCPLPSSCTPDGNPLNPEGPDGPVWSA